MLGEVMKRLILILINLNFLFLLSGCPGYKTISQAEFASKVDAVYTWDSQTWGACSATACGTQGAQTRAVVCVKDNGDVVADSFCTSPKPNVSRTCSAPTCQYTYFYVVSGWSSCSASACGTTGTQTRFVSCTRSDGQVVVDSYCSGTKPTTSQNCSAPACSGAFTPPVRARGTASLSVKDFGAVGNGIHDDTANIQNAINALPATGGTVNIPAGTYLIDTLKSINLKSSMLLKLDSNAILKAKTNSADSSFVVLAMQLHDVEIAGGHIIGERDTHIGTTGEWGHGILIRGSVRVTIRDIETSKNWGDGICLGAFKQRPIQFDDDIVIYNVVARENRRQGLSIGNAINVKVYNTEFSYTNGTSPQFGIDIEPDNFKEGYHYAKNIEIVNCKIHHNQGGGIQAFHQTSIILMKQNEITYNGFGILTDDSFDSAISQNTIAHNRHKGLALATTTNNYTVEKNIFRNNNTDAVGITNDTNPLQYITGLLDSGGNNGTTPHIGTDRLTGVVNILTNQYAK
jgi:parallel beta-helix repeat protein